jgi:CheY-like chemotaxis protein/two-component sensor histidine kinase
MAREAAEPGSRQARQLDQVVQAGLRGRQQVARILAFSRGQARAQQPFALGTLVAEVLDHLDGARPAGVHVQRELQGPPVVVAGDPTALYEAVMNLCTNAIQAMGPTGVLRVAVRVAQNEAPRTLYDQELPAGRHACITVTDNGPGMTPDVLARLFEPFFTTKGRGGTGLGLAVVHGVVTDMGGAIDVRSAPGEGTVFALYLPLSTAAPVATPGLSQATLPSGEGQCVLVVDDEPTLVELGEELLASLGYEPVGTSDPQAALQAFTQDPGRFDLLLTDENMPGLSGTQLAQAVRAIRPDLPVLLVSGHGGPAFDARVQAAGIGQVLGKPLTRDELARALQRCLQRCTS